MNFLVSAIITLAFFAESLFGFGGGLISIPLTGLIIGVKDAVTLVLIFQLLMGLLIFKTYKQTSWAIAVPMTFGLLIGTFVGTYFLASVDDFFLRKFLAVSIALFLIKTIFFRGFNFGSHRQKPWGFLAGVLGGLFQGIIGTGGPIFTMYLTVVLPVKTELRATLIYLFFATSIIRALLSYSLGLFHGNILSLALPTIPFFLVAITLGQIIHTKINNRYYQYTINLILLFAGISMLLS